MFPGGVSATDHDYHPFADQPIPLLIGSGDRDRSRRFGHDVLQVPEQSCCFEDLRVVNLDEVVQAMLQDLDGERKWRAGGKALRDASIGSVFDRSGAPGVVGGGRLS